MSNIDVTVPVYGNPTTQSVRDNFSTAHDEITALQSEVAALQGVTTGGPWLPMAGGEISGNLTIDGHLLIGTTIDAGYKLDVNTTGTTGARFVVSGGGNNLVLQSPTAFTPPAAAASAFLQVIGAPGANPAITIDAAYSAGGGAAVINGRNYNAAAPTSGTPAVGLLLLRGFGWDGTAYTANPRVLISLFAAAAFTTTSNPTGISFSTTPINSTATAEAMRVSPSGNLLIGTTTDGAYKLDVAGGPSRFAATPTTAPVVINAGFDPTSISAYATGTTLQINGPVGGNSVLAMDTAGPGTNSFYSRVYVSTGVAAGSSLLTMRGYGWDTALFGTGPSIVFVTDEGFASGKHGSHIEFRTVAVGGNTVNEVMRASASGNLLIGTTTDGTIKLDCNGPARVGTFGANGTAPIAKPTVSGAKGSNAALASLITALANYGMITDTTTA